MRGERGFAVPRQVIQGNEWLISLPTHSYQFSRFESFFHSSHEFSKLVLEVIRQGLPTKLL